MRRKVLGVLALGVAFMGMQSMTKANAAELFNAPAKKADTNAVNAPMAEPVQKGGNITLFNKKHDERAAKKQPSSGLKSVSRVRTGGGYASPDAQDAYAAYQMYDKQFKSYMGSISVSGVHMSKVRANKGWRHMSAAAFQNNMGKTQYALQLEYDRRNYAARYAEADRRISAHKKQIEDERHEQFLFAQVQNKESWEEKKLKRRQALFGKQVAKAMQAHGLVAEVAYDAPTQSTAQPSGSSSKRIVSKAAKSANPTPQLFNNVTE